MRIKKSSRLPWSLAIWVSFAATGSTAQDVCDTSAVLDCLQELSKAVQSYQARIAALEVQILQAESPVGTVLLSTLPPDQFLSADTPYIRADKWRLADGGALPPGSMYEKLSGATTVPDLRLHQSARLLLDVVEGSAGHGQDIAALRSSGLASETWHFLFSLRDITGNRYNNDFEQDMDQFRIIPDNGTLVVDGRTLNWKHNRWGDRRGGLANYMGIASKPSGLYHYVKIN